MKFLKTKHLRTILISLVLAICTGHYFENPQAKYFSMLKAYIMFGAPYHQENEGKFLLSRSMGGDSVETYVNPVVNAQIVLDQSEKYLITKFYPSYIKHIYEDTSIQSDEIVRVTDLFMRAYLPETIDGKSVVRFPYYVDIDYIYGDIKTPWFSGMANGHILILALASLDITGDLKYKTFAQNIVNGFEISVINGGFTYKDISGTLFEEYAYQSVLFVDAPKVLNGHLFAIDGLFWYWHFNQENHAIRDLLIDALVYMDNNIHRYYSQFWSYYDDYQGKRHYADGYYHSLHIKQLRRITEFYLPFLGVDYKNLNKASYDFERFTLLPLGFVERLLIQRNRMIFLVFFSNFFLIYIYLILFRRFLNKKKFS